MEFYINLLGFGIQPTFPTCAVHDLVYYFIPVYIRLITDWDGETQKEIIYHVHPNNVIRFMPIIITIFTKMITTNTNLPILHGWVIPIVQSGKRQRLRLEGSKILRVVLSNVY